MSVPTTITLPDGTASGQLSLVVGPDVALGDATVTVTAVGPDASATADIEITVDPTPGSIDSSYGDAGQAVFPKSMGGGDIRDIAVDADGNAVVVFSYSNGDNNDFGVARMLPDGTLDPTFGTDGWTFADGGDDSGDSPRSVAIDGDGTILVGGNGRVAASTDTDLLVMRFESDGTLDAAFGTGGVAAIDSGSSESGGAIAIDGDGNIAIVGNFGCCGSGDVVVGRFDSGGTPDATFDGDGVLTFDLGGGDEDRADGVTIDGSDRIVIVGSGRSASSTSHPSSPASPTTGRSTAVSTAGNRCSSTSTMAATNCSTWRSTPTARSWRSATPASAAASTRTPWRSASPPPARSTPPSTATASSRSTSPAPTTSSKRSPSPRTATSWPWAPPSAAPCSRS
jgi:uncharacterized delta-60 repeat protein